MTTRSTNKQTRASRMLYGVRWARRDPTPGPYPGTGPIYWRPRETPEQRAFRRFPISREPAGDELEVPE